MLLLSPPKMRPWTEIEFIVMAPFGSKKVPYTFAIGLVLLWIVGPPVSPEPPVKLNSTWSEVIPPLSTMGA
jgi:hypothetical protein